VTLRRIVVFGKNLAARPALCSGAAALADEVIAIVVGTDADADAVAQTGARVLHLGACPPEIMLEDFGPSVGDLIADATPDLILLQASRQIRAMAGALAVRLDAPIVSDATAFVVGDEGINFQLVRYGGATVQACRTSARPLIAIISADLPPAPPPATPGSVTKVEVHVTPGPVRRVSRTPRTEESVDLGAAKVVVGVGRGIGSQANIAVVADAARRLGAELACSRPIAEGAGWMPKNRYLGVSGAVIHPQLYLALGVSGQVQHMVGVNAARTIVAINNDKNAPIFGRCDLGLVADLEVVVPTLAEKLT
jgi:electron transfer flavoprotein alpha subunit